MLLAMQIIVVAAGIFGTLVAFGGDTWVKAPKPFISRITLRGWFSIFFLLVSLSAGIVEKILTNSHDGKKDLEAKNRVEKLQGHSKTRHQD